MSGSPFRARLPRRWRWATLGLQVVAAAALGFGCRSSPGPAARVTPPLFGALPPKPTASDGTAVAAKLPTEPTEPAGSVTPASLDLPDPDPLAPAQAVTVPATAAAPDEETLDLGVALRLAGVGNPTVNLARERIREALAEQLGARSLLLPSITIGGNYHYHSGFLQASPGFIRNVTSSSLYMGFGARTLAAESVAFPGVRLFAHLGDAVYEPLAARQRVTARRSDAQAVQNETLLRVATAYLELVGAEARLAVLRKGQTDVGEVLRMTQVYAEKGQGRKADADRAQADADLLLQQIRRAEEEVGIASANLAEVVSLDPAVRLRTPGGAVEEIRLVPEDGDPGPLLATALRSRPEIYARSAEVMEAQVRVRQEKVRPFVPTVSVGYSGGLFGGGSNLVAQTFGPLSGRSDFDAFAVWNLQNLGFGNRARVRTADAIVGEALANYDRAANQVRDEVMEAQAEAQAAARRVETAKAAVATAEEGFRLEEDRIRTTLARPIEVLDSFNQLVTARQELIRAVVGYDIAQFRLFVAIGNNPITGGGPVGK